MRQIELVVVAVMALFASRSFAFSHGRHLRQQFRAVSSVFDEIEGRVYQIELIDVDGKVRQVNCFDSGLKNSQPPIVILGGTGQSLHTYAIHIRHFARERRLIIPELRCQGKTNLLSEYGTMGQHVQDFNQLMKKLNVPTCNLVGFSFGGRVACAVAAHTPHLVSRLSMTGVPLRRPVVGSKILQSWEEGLKANQVRSVCWSFVLNGYSYKFLESCGSRLDTYVDMVEQSIDPVKLLNLISKSRVDSDDDRHSTLCCAPLVKCPTQVVAATEDRIAGFEEVRQLASSIEGAAFCSIPSGHLLPFEQPVQWRRTVLDFFNTA